MSNPRTPGPRAYVNVFARFPQRGRVKSRLARTVGELRALALHRRMTKHSLAVAAGVRGCRRVLWTAGPHWHPAFAGVPPSARRCQPPGDLGARMSAAIAWSLRRGAPGIVVGADIPALEVRHLAAAVAALEAGSDLVLGPATDGGYYLVGLARPAPALFRGVAWGTGRVLAQTRRRAGRAGLSMVLLESLTDVDEAADLRARGGA